MVIKKNTPTSFYSYFKILILIFCYLIFSLVFQGFIKNNKIYEVFIYLYKQPNPFNVCYIPNLMQEQYELVDMVFA